MSSKSDSGSEDVSMVYESPQSRRVNGEQQQSQQSQQQQPLYDEDVCRDFMRSVCTRGKRCRYRHPVSEDNGNSNGRQQDHTSPQNQQQNNHQNSQQQNNNNHNHHNSHPPPRRDITFCHDYQNNGCTRPNCKFLHCSRDEEDYFHRTGLLPSRLNHGGYNPAAAGLMMKAELPLCRDYLNGDCKRGSKCKYRHAKGGDHDFDRKFDRKSGGGGDYDRRGGGDDRIFDHGGGGPPPDSAKRRRMLDDLSDYDVPRDRDHHRSAGLSYTYLEDENSMLRRKVEELKKQVSDLTAINEVLLEQNARYRVSKATAMQVPVSQQPTLTAVAMAAAAASPASPAVPPPAPPPHPTATPGGGLLPHAAQPPPAALTAQQLNSSLTQQVALNSDLATQAHALQTAQRLAAAAGAGGLGQQQQQQSSRSHAAAVALNPTAGGGVTMTQQNLAAGVVTMTQQPNLVALSQSNLAVSMAPMRPAPQLQVAHSLTQNLGAPTSLVSYPIMSQNMRSAVEPSSLTH